jgi:hypothetical protein
MTNHAAEAEVMRHLARYFHDHPLASDTPEGMRRWWFAPDLSVSESEIMSALGRLKALGIAEERIAADGRVRYRRVHGPAADAALCDVLASSAPSAEAGDE